MRSIIKTKYKVSDIFLGGLFVVTPFWSLPLIVFQLFKTRRKFYTRLISAFFGITATLLAPTGDLYRLYVMYFDFQEFQADSFLNFLSDKPDFLFYTLLYIFAKMGWSIRIIIFLLVYSFFQLSFNTLLKQGKKISIIAILLFVAQFDFLLQGLFLRFPLAMLIVIYTYLRKLEGKKYTLLLLIIASMVHFSALITIPLYFLTRMSQNKLNTYLLISLLIMPFGNSIFIFLTTHLLQWFPEIPLKEKLSDYFLGYWALEYFDERTWKALILFYFERTLYVIILMYFLLTREKNMHRKTSILFLILINILFSFPNLFSRYLIVAVFFGLLTILIENKKSGLTSLIKISLAAVITIVFASRILAQQKNIRVGYIPHITYNNIISLSFKSYDLKWIDKNIDKATASPKSVKSL